MHFRKIKIFIMNALISVLGCILVITAHNFGYNWYIDNFTPQSRGVGLAFVISYMRCIIIPIIFLSAFIKLKHSIFILSLAFIYMFYSWYGTNPLRVILMFTSSLSGYALIICLRYFKIGGTIL